MGDEPQYVTTLGQHRVNSAVWIPATFILFAGISP